MRPRSTRATRGGRSLAAATLLAAGLLVGCGQQPTTEPPATPTPATSKAVSPSAGPVSTPVAYADTLRVGWAQDPPFAFRGFDTTSPGQRIVVAASP